MQCVQSTMKHCTVNQPSKKAPSPIPKFHEKQNENKEEKISKLVGQLSQAQKIQIYIHVCNHVNFVFVI